MKYLLITTATCPKCPAIKKFVTEKITFAGAILDNTSSDFATRIAKFNVTAAPTLLIFDQKNKEIFRGTEIYEVEEFLNKNS
jgi:hypothetical protein